MDEHEAPTLDPEPSASSNPVEATIEAVRARLPPMMEAGGRALEEVAQRAPGAIDTTITAVDHSSSATLALVGGVSAGLSVGLMMSRAPRILGLVLAGVALVLLGTLLGRRGGDLLDRER